MSSITKSHIGNYVYVFESTSFWDPKHKYPRNNRKSVGRIDPVFGETYYKQEYIDQLKKEGKPTDNMKVWIDQRKASHVQENMSADTQVLAQEILASVKNFGLAYMPERVRQ